eukprot:scaffold20065_cov60-Phaeocystis_antarctica.AAC.4
MVTWPTSHAATGWLNALAPRNILSMLVTWPTSHALRSSSNVERHAVDSAGKWILLKRKRMSVTALTSHAEIGPCVACAAAASAHHSPSATWRLYLLLNADALPARVRSSPNTSLAILLRCLAARAAGTAARLRLESAWPLDDSTLAALAPRATPRKRVARPNGECVPQLGGNLRSRCRGPAGVVLAPQRVGCEDANQEHEKQVATGQLCKVTQCDHR